MGRGSLAATVALAGAVLLAGCDDAGSGTPGPGEPGPVQASWTEASLPLPPGPSGRVAVRDAAWCDGHWYVVGGILGAEGTSRPGAWTSTDGEHWTPVPTAPVAFYAQRAVLTSVACRGTEVAAVGAKSGGAHGLPRTTTWYRRPDGTLVDAPADFEVFGGPEAVSVDEIAAGTDDWLIAGNRLRGAAVWVSPGATAFRLVDHDPALSSGPYGDTTALSQVHGPAGWTLVGREQPTGRGLPVPLAWTSADGLRWQRQQVPAGSSGFADLERVTAVPGGLLAVGLRGERFGAWNRTGDDTWKAGPSFGRQASGGAPFVTGLVATDDGALATISDGRRFGLWEERSGGWRQVEVPVRPPNNGASQMNVATDGTAVLLLTDDGKAGRVWLRGTPR